ncbi:MAG: hypothetical protein GYA24_03205 [Candidatus Lokiarchaeota archaeon]|nr:hypothetical protein [Candidatus Lokiarchaeota archaeon]
MFVVEIGILHREKSLVHVSFYRHDEALSAITKDQIISGIYSIVPEIFRDHVLKQLTIAKYTILFNGFELKPAARNAVSGGPHGHVTPGMASSRAWSDPENIVLAYAIVDLMSDNLDKIFLKAVQEKIKKLGDMFIAECAGRDDPATIDLEPFKQKILVIFKDMLKRPVDRFDDMWPGTRGSGKARK